MTSDDQKTIIIKLEIQIPTSGGQPEVKLTAPETKAVGRARRFLGISEPPGGPTYTLTTGEICLRGNVNNSNATQVYAQIFPPGAPIPQAPFTTPPAGATLCNLNSVTGVYSLPLLGLITGYPNSLQHQVVTWEYVYPNYLQNDSVGITPIWGQYTECTYPPSPPDVSQQSTQSSPLSFELLPVEWSLEVKSFMGTSLSRLNGHWRMKLISSPNQKITYCNHGDGSSVPRIQMIKESPLSEFWQLQFEVEHQSVTYQLATKQFCPQESNTFSQPVTEDVADDCSIPPRVAVRPV